MSSRAGANMSDELRAAAKIICTRLLGNTCVLVHDVERPPCTDENCKVWPVARAALTAAAQVRERAGSELLTKRENQITALNIEVGRLRRLAESAHAELTNSASLLGDRIYDAVRYLSSIISDAPAERAGVYLCRMPGGIHGGSCPTCGCEVVSAIMEPDVPGMRKGEE